MPIMPIRFVVLCHARTGSTLLGSLLAAHPQIEWANEYFKTIRRQARGSLRRRLIYTLAYQQPLLYLNRQARRCRHPVYGCKLMPHYVADIERTVPRLQRHGWRIVYLQRRDAFTGALSRFVAAAGKHWITRSDHVALTAPPVRIESAELLAEIRGRIELDQREQRSVAGRPHLKLIYEDDLADAACWTATTERVFAYLGLPALPVQHAINKTWDRPYQEIVANYDELAAAVRSSELAYVLSLVAATQRQAQQDLGEE